MTYVARCRSCQAPVVWATTVATDTKAGRRIPIDADPADPTRALRVKIGNLLFINETAGDGSPLVRYVTGGPHRTHFATCPNAKGHRRG